MRKYDLITPEGTKDFLFEECYVRREIEQNLHDLFHSKGYSELTTPGIGIFRCVPVRIRSLSAGTTV